MDRTTQSRDVLERLERPTAEARGLPGHWYHSEEFARLESERLFARTWVCAGFVHELEAPGAVIPVQVAGFPVFLVRDSADAIHAYHNVCPHRGSRLVKEPCGGASIIKCPYHAWAFDLDGRLKSTPHWGGYRQHELAGFDRSRHRLQPIRCVAWHDWLFINIDAEAPELCDYMATFSPHFAEYDLGSLRHHRTTPYRIAGNWKIVEENFLEVIHLPPVHKRLSEYAPFQDHRLVVDGHCIGTIIETGLPAAWDATALPRFPAMSRDARNAKNLSLFPNFKLVIGPDHCCSMVELPDGAGLTRQRWDFYFVEEGASDPRYEKARASIIDFFCETNEEDLSAIEELHIGRRSPGYAGGVFSAVWEPAVQQFQRLVAGYIDA
jgi:choline monooxygenase